MKQNSFFYDTISAKMEIGLFIFLPSFMGHKIFKTLTIDL